MSELRRRADLDKWLTEQLGNTNRAIVELKRDQTPFGHYYNAKLIDRLPTDAGRGREYTNRRDFNRAITDGLFMGNRLYLWYNHASGNLFIAALAVHYA